MGILGLALGLLLPPTVAEAQEGRSATQVKELTALMTARQLDAVAAQDPEAPDHFVAALLMPGVQLLLVSARYPSPPELQAQLAQQKYRDVYTALHQPSAQATRFFLMDAGCDGLGGDGDGVDVLYEKGTVQTLFDGQWKKQGLSEDTYTKRAQDAEASYSRFLAVLTASLKTPAGSVTP
jgi:hypothetical protein